MNKKNLLIMAAITGALASAPMSAQAAAADNHDKGKSEKSSCKGKDGCKGEDGKEKASCKGKDGCKGEDGKKEKDGEKMACGGKDGCGGKS